MEVYRLSAEGDNPLFGSFSLAEHPSLLGNEALDLDFHGADVGKLHWTPNRLSDVWCAPHVRGFVTPFCDFPGQGNYVPIFSELAVNALRDLLEPNGELLPVHTIFGTYFAFNILIKSTALDIEASDVDFPVDIEKETAFGIDRFVFKEAKVKEHAIFRIREFPIAVMVTDEFKNRVESAGLLGLEFAKLWPLPEGVRWVRERRQLQKAREIEIAPLKANTLYVSLGVSNKKPTEEDLEAGELFALELSESLAPLQKTPEDYIGIVDEVEEMRKSIRLTFFCPDVDKLAEQALPRLQKIAWAGSVEVTKVYGGQDEPKAKKVKIRVK